jgi:hypothetical protein
MDFHTPLLGESNVHLPNHVMVPNPNEMISTAIPMTRTSTQMLEPRSADKRLDPKHGEAQHQVWLPQSFMLIDTISNPIGTSILGGVSRKMFSSIPRSKAPISLIGAAKIVCQTPFFVIETLAISSIQPAVVFHLAITLCENGGTLKVMVRSKDTFVPPIIPHPVSKANRMEVSKVQLEYWHVVMAKLHDLLTWPTIDRTNVILGVLVVHNEEGVVQLRGALAKHD